MHGRSRDAAYWRHRIERDHPEIAARLAAGEIASVRAAAVIAGLIREPSGLMQLRRAWRRSSPEERAAFMGEVGIAELVPQAKRTKRKRVASERNEADLFSPPLPFPQEPIPLRREPAPSRASPALSLEPSTASLRVVVPRAAPEFVVPPSEAEPPTVLEIARGERTPAPSEPIEAAASAGASVTVSIAPAEGNGSGGGEESGEEGEASARSMPEPLSYAETVAESGRGASAERARPLVMETSDGRVKVGQCYVKVDAGGIAWQVVSIFAGPLGVPHVRIASVEEPDTLRAVSVSALLDRNRYRLVS